MKLKLDSTTTKNIVNDYNYFKKDLGSSGLDSRRELLEILFRWYSVHKASDKVLVAFLLLFESLKPHK